MVVKTGVSLPDAVYQDLKRLVEQKGYKSVSQAVRDAVELFVAFNRWWLGEGEVTGAIQVLLEDEDSYSRIAHLVASYRDVVRATMTVSLTKGLLTVIVVRGSGAKVKQLYKTIVSTRGALAVHAGLLPEPRALVEEARF